MDLAWLAFGFAVILLGVLCGAAWLIVSVSRIRSRSRRLEPRRCLNCGSVDLRPSWPSGLKDRIFHACGCEPLRCRACYFRFYRSTLGDPAPGPETPAAPG